LSCIFSSLLGETPPKCLYLALSTTGGDLLEYQLSVQVRRTSRATPFHAPIDASEGRAMADRRASVSQHRMVARLGRDLAIPMARSSRLSVRLAMVMRNSSKIHCAGEYVIMSRHLSPNRYLLAVAVESLAGEDVPLYAMVSLRLVVVQRWTSYAGPKRSIHVSINLTVSQTRLADSRVPA
jgi:hypothetical protein